MLIPNLMSEFRLKLPVAIYDRMAQTIACLFSESRKLSPETISQSPTELMWLNLPLAAEQASVLMSYDFHVDLESQEFRLIEINTNASGFLIVTELAQLLSATSFSDAQTNLWQSFVSEWGTQAGLPSLVAIVDEKPVEQKMYVEFLKYQNFFGEHGIQSVICDSRDLSIHSDVLMAEGRPVQAVYNRLTDFLFNAPSSEILKTACIMNYARISPTPWEYIRLADKLRLADLRTSLAKDPANADALRAMLVSQSMLSFDRDELWRERRRWMFKPSQSFGGKAVYRGGSISRSMFDRLNPETYTVQEFFPAGTIDYNNQSWKFDLRVYAYRDQIQLMAARIYQGQVTNFRSPGGGFALVDLT